MEDGIDEINKQMKEGKLVIAGERILEDKAEKKQEGVDAVTAPTMTSRFITMSKKFQEQKKNSEK